MGVGVGIDIDRDYCWAGGVSWRTVGFDVCGGF